MAAEKQGRSARARDQARQRAHQLRDCEDRLAGGCERVGGSGGPKGLLLLGARFESSSVLTDQSALQGISKGYLKTRVRAVC